MGRAEGIVPPPVPVRAPARGDGAMLSPATGSLTMGREEPRVEDGGLGLPGAGEGAWVELAEARWEWGPWPSLLLLL